MPMMFLSILRCVLAAAVVVPARPGDVRGFPL